MEKSLWKLPEFQGHRFLVEIDHREHGVGDRSHDGVFAVLRDIDVVQAPVHQNGRAHGSAARCTFPSAQSPKAAIVRLAKSSNVGP
jgi:hypothetical protein